MLESNAFPFPDNSVSLFTSMQNEECTALRERERDNHRMMILSYCR